MISCDGSDRGSGQTGGQVMEITFNFSIWFAILMIALIIICGSVVAMVFRRITTRHEKQIEQLQQRG